MGGSGRFGGGRPEKGEASESPTPWSHQKARTSSRLPRAAALRRPLVAERACAKLRGGGCLGGNEAVEEEEEEEGRKDRWHGGRQCDGNKRSAVH